MQKWWVSAHLRLIPAFDSGKTRQRLRLSKLLLLRRFWNIVYMYHIFFICSFVNGHLDCFHVLEKEMATHSSILAWRILWAEEPGGLLSMGLHRVGHNWKWLSMHACIGEGSGNPLQYSCLENPRDRGAWWTSVHGVAQSWTRLKQQQQLSDSKMAISDLHLLVFSYVYSPPVFYYGGSVWLIAYGRFDDMST